LAEILVEEFEDLQLSSQQPIANSLLSAAMPKPARHSEPYP
jgi:hypothetical protein